MGLGQFVERMFRTVTPFNNRVAGGIYLSHIPAMPDADTAATAVEGITLAPAAAIATYGNYVIMATAKVVPAECWIEGISLRIPAAAAGERLVGIELGAATGAAVPANMEAQVGAFFDTAAPGPQSQYIPLRPPIYVPAPTAAELAGSAARIIGAVAAAGTASAPQRKPAPSHRK